MTFFWVFDSILRKITRVTRTWGRARNERQQL